MLHNVVVLYRRTITFSYITSTNQSQLHIPTVVPRALLLCEASPELGNVEEGHRGGAPARRDAGGVQSYIRKQSYKLKASTVFIIIPL